ncbi:MAG: endonuclease/exonuclease/phosphatase family protein [Cyanobacteriota bacterium]
MLNKPSFIAFAVLLITFLSVNIYIKAETEVDDKQKLKYNQDIFNTITYDELVTISEGNALAPELQVQVDYVLNNSVVDNTISKDSSVKNNNKVLGDFIRVASWNIARGIHLDKIIKIFNEPEEMARLIEEQNPKKANIVKTQLGILKHADIITLSEVDAGMPRTEYKVIVEEFAKSIGFNYAYGIEFLEVDPARLGLEEYRWSEEADLFPEGIDIDKDKYRGLHGNAILSRFPLKNVRIIRLPKYYDWYTEERIKVGNLESMRRKTASKLFGEKVLREIRYGSRIALVADAEVPGLDTPVTIVAAHLENRTLPVYRKKQMKFLLKNIEDKQNPVVIGGDFNTALHDAAPIDAKNARKSRLNRFLSKLKIYNIPYKMIIVPATTLPSTARKRLDPSVKSIPIVSVNPERKLFNLLKSFEFKDDTHFDFRSTPGKFVGRPGNLANSNERKLKGFVETYEFQRPLYVGRFKLDWLFVKGYCKKAVDKECTYKMAPHFGSTLVDLNYQYNEIFADHAPVTVDLPLEDPGLLSKPEVKELKTIIKEKKKKKDPEAVQRLKEKKLQEKNQQKLEKQNKKNSEKQ